MASKYRYTLHRTNEFGDPDRSICWVMLNPSTADAQRDDQTIRKVRHFSAIEGSGKIVVVNLFALRATKPEVLLTVPAKEAQGLLNYSTLVSEVCRASTVVFAWGAWWSNVPLSKRPSRISVESLAKRYAIKPLCLGRTADGSPKHPCYLAYKTQFEPFPL